MTLNETLKKYNSTVIKVTEVIVNKEYAEKWAFMFYEMGVGY